MKLVSAGAAGVALSATGIVRAQVKEEAENESVTIVRKGVDKPLEVINIDLLETEAKRTLSEVVYVFIANGAGEQWTLRENRRAFGDYVFTPNRMGGIVRDKIDTSITLVGEKLRSPIIVSPMGSHGLVHPEGEVATVQGAAKTGTLVAVSSASTRSMEDIARSVVARSWCWLQGGGVDC